MISSPCFGCRERTTEPSCHDAARCAKWRVYREAKERESKARQDMAMLDNHKNLRAVKSKNLRGWTYEKGDKGGIEYGEKKKRYVRGD